MSEGPGHVGPSRPVLVTRPAGRGDGLVTLLAQHGVVVEHRPLTRLLPVRGPEVDLARERLAAGQYSHLVLTSRTAVEAFCLAESPSADSAGSTGSTGSTGSPGAPALPASLGVPPHTQVVAVGEGTAAALAAIGIRADVVAAGSGAALVEAMPVASSAPTSRVLFPASGAASPTVPEGLRSKGYRVDQVTVYRPEPVDLPEASAQALRTGGYSAMVLTSPMIARRAAAIGIHPSTAILTIGDPTSEAVREAGLRVTLQAEEPTDAALAAVVVRALDLGP
ncbi:MAG: uroporphyrinogen-III synthase [Brachybacterium tyrofermentans]|uniref:uroporphyrinogen-III synthase n=1 Tax=Brachybacterium tyrofermentans TaxID=47848 RepID=UPI003F8F4281